MDKGEEFLQRALEDKALSKLELIRLPIEEKLKIIALLQRRANAIRRASGRPTKPEWPLREVGVSSSSRVAGKARSHVVALGLPPEITEMQDFNPLEVEDVAARLENEYLDLEARFANTNPGVDDVLKVLGTYQQTSPALQMADRYLAMFGEEASSLFESRPFFSATMGTHPTALTP